MKSALYVLFAVALLTVTTSQPPPPPSTEGPQTLVEILTPIFNSLKEASRAIFTAEVARFQTPIVVRYITFFTIAAYEPQAACNPKALSFFGVRDQIDPKFCNPLSRIRIFHYILHRIITQEFPDQAPSIAAFQRANGLTPESLSTDTSTEVGWANVAAFRAMKYFRSDGWNSLGDRNRDRFRQPYSDFTNYKPVNLAQKPVSKLDRPLRWQPLVQPVRRSGEFRAQVHVVPHVGRAKPLALTKEDLDARV